MKNFVDVDNINKMPREREQVRVSPTPQSLLDAIERDDKDEIYAILVDEMAKASYVPMFPLSKSPKDSVAIVPGGDNDLLTSFVLGYDRVEPLKYMLEKRMVHGNRLNYPLSKAVVYPWPDRVKLLLQYGANVNFKNTFQQTAAYMLFYCYNDEIGKEILNILIGAGIDLNSQDEDGYTVLGRFCCVDDTHSLLWAVKMFLDAGADVNIACDDGYTPLMSLWSYMFHDDSALMIMDVFQMMLARTKDINHIDDDGWNVLIHWIRDHSVDNHLFYSMIDLILDSGIDINCKSSAGYTALMLAVKYNHLRLVKTLFIRGADKTPKSESDETLLMHADPHNFEMVEFLLNNSDIDDLHIYDKCEEGLSVLQRWNELLTICDYEIETDICKSVQLLIKNMRLNFVGIDILVSWCMKGYDRLALCMFEKFDQDTNIGMVVRLVKKLSSTSAKRYIKYILPAK